MQQSCMVVATPLGTTSSYGVANLDHKLLKYVGNRCCIVQGHTHVHFLFLNHNIDKENKITHSWPIMPQHLVIIIQ
jgi:hypothetical protein